MTPIWFGLVKGILVIIDRILDSVEDGPEVNLIKFFREHLEGKRDGIHSCFHIGERFRASYR
jgi:hypothetical protein